MSDVKEEDLSSQESQNEEGPEGSPENTADSGNDSPNGRTSGSAHLSSGNETNEDQEKPSCSSESAKLTAPIQLAGGTTTQSQNDTQNAVKNEEDDNEDSKWHTVGIFSGHTANVTDYIDNNVWSSANLDLTAENLPDLSGFPRMNLEQGSAYRFRIRAINELGTSEWSEVSIFKTCLPGFPGAPSSIKITKMSDKGAHLTWEPPPAVTGPNDIIEYSVYLAVKPAKDKELKSNPAAAKAPAQLAFVRVYVGVANQCYVSHETLDGAHIDSSSKPAIIFRIAARNDKGYGPATQVRWLQETVPTVPQYGGLKTAAVPYHGGAPSPTKRSKLGGFRNEM